MSVQPVTRFKKTLVTRLVEGGSETTIELSSMTDFRGNTISFSDLGGDLGLLTIDSGTDFEEIISFTGISGNTLTGVTRGLPFKGNSFTAVTANKKPHEPGAEVIMTNSHHWDAKYRVDTQTAQTIDGVKTFSSSPVVPTPSGGTDAANKDYADGLAIAGAPNGSTTTKGIYEQATLAETKSATATGATGAVLVANAAQIAGAIQDSSWIYAVDSVGTDSYAVTIAPAITALTAGLRLLVKVATANTGACTLNVNGLGAVAIKKLRDQDPETGDIEANQIIDVIYDGTNFQLQTPIASLPTTALLSEMGTFFAATDALAAEMENLTDGGDASDSHNHSSLYTNSRYVGVGTYDMSGTTSNTFAHGLGVSPVFVEVRVRFNNTTTVAMSDGAYNGTNYVIWAVNVNDASSDGTSNTEVAHIQGSGVSNTATCSVDATNVTLTWTKNGSPTGTAHVMVIAHKL